MRIKFTKTSIDKKCLPPQPGEASSKGNPIRQKAYWDTSRESPQGFGLIASPSCSTFVVQRSVRGRTVRVALGRYGDLTLEQAREKARTVAQEMAQGIDPNAAQRQREELDRWKRYTLREARVEHMANMKAKDCAPRSIESMIYYLDQLLPDWLDCPLTEINGVDCIDRHRYLTQKHGAGSAPFAEGESLLAPVGRECSPQSGRPRRLRRRAGRGARAGSRASAGVPEGEGASRKRLRQRSWRPLSPRPNHSLPRPDPDPFGAGRGGGRGQEECSPLCGRQALEGRLASLSPPASSS
ncbi:MAG: Arm DNA-binding domain-containing protein [Myxococcota bacterium]